MKELVAALDKVTQFLLVHPENDIKRILTAVVALLVTHGVLKKATKALGGNMVTVPRVTASLLLLALTAVLIPAVLQAFAVPMLGKAPWAVHLPLAGGILTTLLLTVPFHWFICRADYGKSTTALLFAVIGFTATVFLVSSLYDGVAGLARGMKKTSDTRDARSAQGL